jgi:hypothetical protein
VLSKVYIFLINHKKLKLTNEKLNNMNIVGGMKFGKTGENPRKIPILSASIEIRT